MDRTFEIADPDQPIKVYRSDTDDYAEDFTVFLADTDQKVVAGQWFDAWLKTTDNRFGVDFGCGTGSMFPTLRKYLRFLLGLDFNSALIAACHAAYPDIPLMLADLTKLPAGLFQASVGVESHVKYYPTPGEGGRKGEWSRLTRAELSMIAPGGSLVNVLQNRGSTYQALIADLIGPELAYDLQPWAREFAAAEGVAVQIDTRDAMVRSANVERALQVGTFMCNLIPRELLLPRVPTRGQLVEWLAKHTFNAGQWQASCKQDFVVFKKE